MFKFIFSKSFIINLLLYVFFVLVGIYFFLRHLDAVTEHNETITVPEFLGYHFSELEALTSESHLRYEIIDSAYFQDEARGAVIAQTPDAGKQVKRGRKIYVTINASQPPQIGLPNLVDMSLRQALSILNTIGIEVNDLVYEPSICTGCVVRLERDSVEMKAGKLVFRGSKVDVVVGSGLSGERTLYPILIGKNYEEAYNILRKRGLNVGALSFENCENKEDSMKALIYNQIPDYLKTKSVNLGQPVSLFFSTDSTIIPKVDVDSILRVKGGFDDGSEG